MKCSGMLVGDRQPNKKRRAGFTLIEVGLAMTLLTVALMAMSASTVAMHSLRRQNRERALAQNQLRTIAESIHAISDQAREQDPDTWAQTVVRALGPGAPAGSIGDRFDVLGLTAQEGEASVGTIEVVVDESTTDAGLGLELGLPRDLNADGDEADADVTTSARLLPVILRSRWQGANGDVNLTHTFYLIGY